MFDWKQYRLSYTQKAQEILDTLTLKEKISLMSGSEIRAEVRGAIQKKQAEHYNERPYRAGGIPEKGVPPMLFADGTRGVVCGRGKATCFPAAVMRGASFHPELEEAVGEAAALETLDAGANLFGGVCVNLPWHPGWGRAQEVYGEDSFLLGEMGAALVRGTQKNGVIACVKHFAFNSMENARFKVSIECSGRTEREVFLPHFKKCIDAGAGAVMSAYNSYRGVPCGQHDYLLGRVLREEWEFDGFVMSDFIWGAKDTAACANAGLDMEMPVTQVYGDALAGAVKDGLVPMEAIDRSALRILRTLLAHQSRIESLPKKSVDFQAHARLALQCAREGITLLRNENGILPIRCTKERRRLVVLGALADQENIGDRGSSQVYAPYVVTLLQGIASFPSGADVVYYEGQSARHCRRLAGEADWVLIVAGNDYSDEGECLAKESGDTQPLHPGGDRIDGLGLKERDLRILRAVSEVRKDAIVALIGGSAITMEEWVADTGAVLMTYYPGMEGGTAFAEILFGKQCPGGRLPFSIPARAADLPAIDWDASSFRYRYLHGYTFLNEQGVRPLYPFGFGLSYTSFRLSGIRAWREEDAVCAEADVQNTGAMEGSEVVQMYVGAEHSSVKRPAYTLKAFQRISLPPGKTGRVSLRCPLGELACYDEQTGSFRTEDIPYEVYIGTSSLRESLWKTVI
ncbi:MAG: glycoside hydrolase family 3 C-terminal domain-containing protein [Eubacteriales bacterium]|nr:glycoside hydrolase family 3 C-terminal domain-containing protein [Eubacteriales bacterium]